MKITGTQILALGVVTIGGVVVFRSFDAASRAAGRVADAVNPLNNMNVFSETFNDTIGAVVDDDDFSIGSALFDLVQRIKGIPPFDPNAKITPPAAFFDANQQESVAL